MQRITGARGVVTALVWMAALGASTTSRLSPAFSPTATMPANSKATAAAAAATTLNRRGRRRARAEASEVTVGSTGGVGGV